MLDNIGPIKFGDEKIIDSLKRNKNIEKTKITIDLKMLEKIGLQKEQAIDLLKRLIKIKK